MLHKIGAALGSNLAELFSGNEEFDVLTKAQDRPVIETDQVRKGTGISLERLVPHSNGYLLQGNVHIIEPGAVAKTNCGTRAKKWDMLLKGNSN